MPLSLEDRQQVEELMIRYAFAVDKGDSEAVFLGIFADDCLIDGPAGFHEGVEGVKQFAARVQNKGITQGRHLITNFLIDGNGDEAHIEAYFVRVRSHLKVAAPPIVDAGTYDCVAIRTGGTWKLKRRTVVVDAWIA